jgi:tetratricopeptide (TPR) repeat protein
MSSRSLLGLLGQRQCKKGLTKTGEVQRYINLFCGEIGRLNTDRLSLLNEMFDTLLSANKIQLASKTIELLETKDIVWEKEDKELYLAVLQLRLADWLYQSMRSSDALVHYEQALNYYKQSQGNLSQTRKDEPRNKQTLFRVLYGIASCFIDDGEYDRADFFTQRVSSPFTSRPSITRRTIRRISGTVCCNWPE